MHNSPKTEISKNSFNFFGTFYSKYAKKNNNDDVISSEKFSENKNTPNSSNNFGKSNKNITSNLFTEGEHEYDSNNNLYNSVKLFYDPITFENNETKNNTVLDKNYYTIAHASVFPTEEYSSSSQKKKYEHENGTQRMLQNGRQSKNLFDEDDYIDRSYPENVNICSDDDISEKYKRLSNSSKLLESFNNAEYNDEYDTFDIFGINKPRIKKESPLSSGWDWQNAGKMDKSEEIRGNDYSAGNDENGQNNQSDENVHAEEGTKEKRREDDVVDKRLVIKVEEDAPEVECKLMEQLNVEEGETVDRSVVQKVGKNTGQKGGQILEQKDNGENTAKHTYDEKTYYYEKFLLKNFFSKISKFISNNNEEEKYEEKGDGVEGDREENSPNFTQLCGSLNSYNSPYELKEYFDSRETKYSGKKLKGSGGKYRGGFVEQYNNWENMQDSENKYKYSIDGNYKQIDALMNGKNERDDKDLIFNTQKGSFENIREENKSDYNIVKSFQYATSLEKANIEYGSDSGGNSGGVRNCIVLPNEEKCKSAGMDRRRGKGGNTCVVGNVNICDERMASNQKGYHFNDYLQNKHMLMQHSKYFPNKNYLTLRRDSCDVVRSKESIQKYYSMLQKLPKKESPNICISDDNRDGSCFPPLKNVSDRENCLFGSKEAVRDVGTNSSPLSSKRSCYQSKLNYDGGMVGDGAGVSEDNGNKGTHFNYAFVKNRVLKNELNVVVKGRQNSTKCVNECGYGKSVEKTSSGNSPLFGKQTLKKQIFHKGNEEMCKINKKHDFFDYNICNREGQIITYGGEKKNKKASINEDDCACCDVGAGKGKRGEMFGVAYKELVEGEEVEDAEEAEMVVEVEDEINNRLDHKGRNGNSPFTRGKYGGQFGSQRKDNCYFGFKETHLNGSLMDGGKKPLEEGNKTPNVAEEKFSFGCEQFGLKNNLIGNSMYRNVNSRNLLKSSYENIGKENLSNSMRKNYFDYKLKENNNNMEVEKGARILQDHMISNHVKGTFISLPNINNMNEHNMCKKKDLYYYYNRNKSEDKFSLKKVLDKPNYSNRIVRSHTAEPISSAVASMSASISASVSAAPASAVAAVAPGTVSCAGVTSGDCWSRQKLSVSKKIEIVKKTENICKRNIIEPSRFIMVPNEFMESFNNSSFQNNNLYFPQSKLHGFDMVHKSKSAIAPNKLNLMAMEKKKGKFLPNNIIDVDKMHEKKYMYYKKVNAGCKKQSGSNSHSGSESNSGNNDISGNKSNNRVSNIIDLDVLHERKYATLYGKAAGGGGEYDTKKEKRMMICNNSILNYYNEVGSRGGNYNPLLYPENRRGKLGNCIIDVDKVYESKFLPYDHSVSKNGGKIGFTNGSGSNSSMQMERRKGENGHNHLLDMERVARTCNHHKMIIDKYRNNVFSKHTLDIVPPVGRYKNASEYNFLNENCIIPFSQKDVIRNKGGRNSLFYNYQVAHDGMGGNSEGEIGERIHSDLPNVMQGGMGVPFGRGIGSKSTSGLGRRKIIRENDMFNRKMSYPKRKNLHADFVNHYNKSKVTEIIEDPNEYYIYGKYNVCKGKNKNLKHGKYRYNEDSLCNKNELEKITQIENIISKRMKLGKIRRQGGSNNLNRRRHHDRGEHIEEHDNDYDKEYEDGEDGVKGDEEDNEYYNNIEFDRIKVDNILAGTINLENKNESIINNILELERRKYTINCIMEKLRRNENECEYINDIEKEIKGNINPTIYDLYSDKAAYNIYNTKMCVNYFLEDKMLSPENKEFIKNFFVEEQTKNIYFVQVFKKKKNTKKGNNVKNGKNNSSSRTMGDMKKVQTSNGTSAAVLGTSLGVKESRDDDGILVRNTEVCDSVGNSHGVAPVVTKEEKSSIVATPSIKPCMEEENEKKYDVEDTSELLEEEKEVKGKCKNESKMNYFNYQLNFIKRKFCSFEKDENKKENAFSVDKKEKEEAKSNEVETPDGENPVLPLLSDDYTNGVSKNEEKGDQDGNVDHVNCTVEEKNKDPHNNEDETGDHYEDDDFEEEQPHLIKQVIGMSIDKEIEENKRVIEPSVEYEEQDINEETVLNEEHKFGSFPMQQHMYSVLKNAESHIIHMEDDDDDEEDNDEYDDDDDEEEEEEEEEDDELDEDEEDEEDEHEGDGKEEGKNNTEAMEAHGMEEGKTTCEETKPKHMLEEKGGGAAEEEGKRVVHPFNAKHIYVKTEWKEEKKEDEAVGAGGGSSILEGSKLVCIDQDEKDKEQRKIEDVIEIFEEEQNQKKGSINVKIEDEFEEVIEKRSCTKYRNKHNYGLLGVSNNNESETKYGYENVKKEYVASEQYGRGTMLTRCKKEDDEYGEEDEEINAAVKTFKYKNYLEETNLKRDTNGNGIYNMKEDNLSKNVLTTNSNTFGNINGSNVFIKDMVHENNQYVHDYCDIEDSMKYKMLQQKEKNRIEKIKKKIKKNKKLTKEDLKLLSELLHHKFLLNEINAIGNYEVNCKNCFDIIELEEYKMRKDVLNMYCDCLSLGLTAQEREFLNEFQLFMPDINIMDDKNILYILRHSKNETKCVFKYFLGKKDKPQLPA
ncbi:hypothetical protein, conserved [Plasmodium ovale curtisi]|uniref:Uncharacterized protein n=1 Tax=Plasmodium ovale curtisi TaxID=864141 RepID=A0A1A8W082_PLAOA|nr:hypothetical protein, conserved [Plasmodium ovale curtisi]